MPSVSDKMRTLALLHQLKERQRAYSMPAITTASIADTYGALLLSPAPMWRGIEPPVAAKDVCKTCGRSHEIYERCKPLEVPR